jgi:hypothetical protein
LSGDGSKQRHTELGGAGFPANGGIDLSKFVFDTAVADLESFEFAEPAFAFGLDDAGFEVVAGLFESGALCGAWSQERASHISMLVDAG